jgi:hypothetical protein
MESPSSRSGRAAGCSYGADVTAAVTADDPAVFRAVSRYDQAADVSISSV